MIADRDLSGLPIRVHYPPRGEGPFPVIVFSHGLGGSRLGYGYLGRCWAAHGYVSIHPSHHESKGLGVFEEAVEGQGAARLEALRAMKEAIDDPRNWEARPRDVARVIDRIDDLGIAALRGKLDGQRIGISGHSYGGYTTLLCAGARLEGGQHWTEPRASAFLAMSPPGHGSRGLGAGSWPDVHRPVLCLTGTKDSGLQGQPPAWREEAFEHLPAGSKTLVVLEGAEHFTFSGGRPRKQADPAHLRQIEQVSLWFWDRHLRGLDAPFPAFEGARVEHK